MTITEVMRKALIRHFGRGLKDTFGNTAKQIAQIAEEIDKICIIANWEDAVAKYKI